MSRTVIWNLRKTVSRAGGVVSTIQTENEAREDGERYIQKLKDEGETVLEVKEEGKRLYITLE